MAKRFDWFWLEVGALLGVLIVGAALRYWLSTVVPFDEAELSALLEATNPSAALRVPMIMLNGASLLLLYLTVRRSAGFELAFAVLLTFQASLTFQVMAMRIRLWPALGLLVMAVLTYVRLTRPARRIPRPWARLCLALAIPLGARELYLLATLQTRMVTIRQESAADPEPLWASIQAAGGGAVTPLEDFRGYELAWPATRSLEQQVALIKHRLRLGSQALAIHGAGEVPQPDGPFVVVYDPAAAAFVAVPEGPWLDTALRVIQPPLDPGG
jgi:hypothetical protein